MGTTELIRARRELELRESPGDGSLGTLYGLLAIFGEWTEIDSMREGHFMERIAPGAFSQTIERDRGRYRALFQHGRDPQLGDKPLGPIVAIGENERGAFYEVSLLDTAYNRDLLPGLKAGLYGTSFRGVFTDETFDRSPQRSETNPDRIPERTVHEVEMLEFGPVTFPAYTGATAAARSLPGPIWTPARRRERLLDLR